MADLSKFNGRYVCEKSENFEEYMKESGVGLLTRKAAANIKVTIEIKIEGNHFTCHQYSTFKNSVLEFDLDTEFEETTQDGRKMKSFVTFKDGKLVHTQKAQKSGDKDSTLTRYMEDDDHLTVICECGSVVCKRFYVREK